MSINKVVPEVNYSPIWETSCRPLFIKSIWLDSGHRHFLLDYKSKHKSQIFKFDQNKREPAQKHDLYNSPILDKDFLLIGLSKTHCQQNSKSTMLLKHSCPRFPSRNGIINQFRWNYDIFGDEMSAFGSNINSDEKMADRVFNWLDLAGRVMSIKPLQECLKQNDKKKSRMVRKSSKSPGLKRSDLVNQVTIMFNKECVPVHLERPARNVDICAISSSAGAIKQLASKMTSSRLYEDSIDNQRNDIDALECIKTRPRTKTVRDTNAGAAIEKSPIQKENSFKRNVKKQLHVFMPSLPKK